MATVRMKRKPKTMDSSPPNPEQLAVISAREGNWKVEAGPGSGKSFCLVNRYVRLVQSGVPQQDILSLTFTNSAAKQMRTRAETHIPVQKIDRVSGWMTFHSLALQFCAIERDHFPFKLAEDVLCLEPVANKLTMEVSRKYELDPRNLRPYISLQKRNRIRPVEAVKQAEKEGKGEKLALAYKMYDARLREIGQLDFDSLLFEMVDMLDAPFSQTKANESRLGLLKRWQYRFCQSDESQDNDALQWQLLRLLTQEHKNLLAVGDAGQNLYSFRGSSSELFMDMGSMFPGCQTLYLAKNHRSTPQIVSLCKQCGPIPELAEKFHSSNPDGPEPEIIGYPSAIDEANAIVAAVKGLVKPDVTVLSRTNRVLRCIEDTFSTEGIKYYYQGRSGFWSQSEVKICLAYAQCAIFPTDAAAMTALRGPFHPSKYIKKTEVGAKVKGRSGDASAIQFLSQYPDDKVRSFVHFLGGLRRYRDIPAQKAFQSILADLRAFDYYEEEETADNSPVDNMRELSRIAGRFSHLKEFLDYTRRASQASKKKEGICVSTVHAYKGSEADTVYFVAVNDGVLPHARSESIEEERNIFFVGISRAKRNLTISYSGIKSMFLDPILEQREQASIEAVFEM